MSRSVRTTVILLFLIVALIAGVTIGRQWYARQDPHGEAWVDKLDTRQAPPDLRAQRVWIHEPARTIHPFSLTDASGATFMNAQLQGAWTFAFVGYTYCPDICPTTLAELRDVLARLDPALPVPRVLLITADPARDTPARLREYLDFFNPAFLGVTGPLPALEVFARDLNAVFLQRDDGQGNVLVDHSAHIALIGPEGGLRAILQPPLKAEDIAQAYTAIVRWHQEAVASSAPPAGT